MAISTFTSREFNQDIGAAKKAAHDGPVFITDRGRPAHVLLTIDEYRNLTKSQSSIIDMLALPGAEEIEFEPGRVGTLVHPADLG